MSALLQVSNLAGGYGRLTVFRDVGLELARGQTIGLLGANGAGKTTLMKTIAGALPADDGVGVDGLSEVEGVSAHAGSIVPKRSPGPASVTQSRA